MKATADHMLIRGDARSLTFLPDRCVQCCVTSPPYFGLRDYGIPGQIGLESTPDAYVAAMVGVFREVRRVLRDDGVLWLNCGDSFNAHPGQRKTTDKVGPKQETNSGSNTTPSRYVPGLKPKDLIGVPWMLAFALRDDGWFLRMDIIWSKNNPMPESVTDRPTKAHEYLFLLAKSERYFYDADAIREPVTSTGGACFGKQDFSADGTGAQSRRLADAADRNHPLGRNKRSVWEVATAPFKGAHFATFPPKLIEPCIKAGTSEKGCCPACGAPWERVAESTGIMNRRDREDVGDFFPEKGGNPSGISSLSGATYQRQRIGTNTWEPSCRCYPAEMTIAESARMLLVPCIVLDPFNGSGTTGAVATGLGRRYIGLDLNPDYLAMARRRIERPHAPVAPGPRENDALPLFSLAEDLP